MLVITRGYHDSDEGGPPGPPHAASPSLRAPLLALSPPSLSALSATSLATSSALLGTPPASKLQDKIMSPRK